jgi:hypothetical protein
VSFGQIGSAGRRDRVEDLPTVNALSHEAAVGGRQDHEQELNLSTVGRDLRTGSTNAEWQVIGL